MVEEEKQLGTFGLFFMWTFYPWRPKDLLNFCCPCLTSYYLPLRPNRLGVRVSSMGYKRWNFCLIYPRASEMQIKGALELFSSSK